MASLVTALLTLISVGVMVVGAALGYVIGQLDQLKKDDIEPMKSKIDTVWNTVFGVESQEGFLNEAEDSHEKIRETIEETRREQNEAHDELVDEFNEVERYLRELNRALRRQDIEVPDEEIDTDELLKDD